MIKLTPLKDPPAPQSFGVFDIEARDWVKLVCLGYFDGEEYFEFFSVADFLRHIFRKAKKPPQVIFAHFGGKYDFLFLIDALIDLGGYEITNCIPRGSSLLSLDIESNGRKISFRDTSAFLPFSLDRVTKKFGVSHKKKSFDFDKFNKMKEGTPAYAKALKELKEYLEYDCRGLYEAVLAYSENPQIKRAGLAYTTASQSLRLFRSYLHEPISGIYGAADEYIRRSYFGGRVEIFKPLFDGPGTINAFDFNSLYPSILADEKNDFPGGIEGLTDKLDFDCLGFFWCKVFVPEQYMPPLPFLHKGKLLFPCGYLEGIWSVAELRNAVEHYGVKILKVKSGYRCHNIGNPFREFITTMYDERLRAKEEKDEITDIICKLAMNSLYGRFGLRKDRENFAFDENQKGFDGKWIIERQFKNIRLGTIPVQLSTSFSNIAIAAYTTSYARIRNLNGAAEWAEKGLYYTDTDCYYTTESLPESKALGGLKLESRGSQACFLLPKTYIVKAEKDDFKIVLEKDDPDNPTKTNKKIVMKGFNSRKVWRSFDFDHFRNALEGELKHLSVTSEPKFATFKRALQKKKILTMLDAETRGIKSTYSKRIIYKRDNGNYDTRPLTLNKNGEIENG